MVQHHCLQRLPHVRCLTRAVIASFIVVAVVMVAVGIVSVIGFVMIAMPIIVISVIIIVITIIVIANIISGSNHSIIAISVLSEVKQGALHPGSFRYTKPAEQDIAEHFAL